MKETLQHVAGVSWPLPWCSPRPDRRLKVATIKPAAPIDLAKMVAAAQAGRGTENRPSRWRGESGIHVYYAERSDDSRVMAWSRTRSAAPRGSPVSDSTSWLKFPTEP